MTVLLFAAALMGGSQDTVGPINLTGRAPIVEPNGVQAARGASERPIPDQANRTGAWIWQDGGTQHSKPTRFRKTFELNSQPQEARVYASADVSYRLWINGHLVARGPADIGHDYDSGAPGPWFDDVRTVSRFLKRGRNVIAAEVIPKGLVGSESTTGHPGLKVDLRVRTSRSSVVDIATNSSWRSSIAPDLADYEGPNGFRIDTTLEPVGWQEAQFDDSHWDPSVLSGGTREPNLISELAPPLEAIILPTGVDRVREGVQPIGNKGGATFAFDSGYAVRYPRVMSARLAFHVKGVLGARLLIAPNEANAAGFNRREEILAERRRAMG